MCLSRRKRFSRGRLAPWSGVSSCSAGLFVPCWATLLPLWRVNTEEKCIKYREPLRPPCKRSKRPSKTGVGGGGWGVPDQGFFYIKIHMERFV